MIVRNEDTFYLLVTQPDHAKLSGAIMQHWQAEGLPAHPRRRTILLATAEHDNGWMEPDAAPLVDRSGHPYDFVAAPDDVKQGVWPRGVARISQQDRRAGALLAQHALTVLKPYRGSPGWETFFDEMQSLKQRQLESDDERELDAEYRFVFLGDLLSLIFCNAWRKTFSVHGYTIHLTGDAMHVAPDPFGGVRFAIDVRARRIARRAYASDRELGDTLAAAPEIRLEGYVEGQ